MSFLDVSAFNISAIHNPWRDKWRQASFRGAPFFVEVNAKASGRRTVFHEFPKRDVPYAEDMGRRGYEFSVVGYLIGPYYLEDRDALETALQAEGPGVLTLPTRPDLSVNCVRYSGSERRTQGGYYEVEMVFVESGVPVNALANVSTAAVLTSTANAAALAASVSLNGALLVGAITAAGRAQIP